MFKKVKYFMEYFKYLENPFSCLKFKFGFSDSCKVKVKNNDNELELNSVFSLDKLMGLMRYVSNNKLDEFLEYVKNIDDDYEVVIIGGIKYYNVFNSKFRKKHQQNYESCSEEYFFDVGWEMVNCSGRNVIDIGGNVGDSALFFAKNGAKVIGLEPVKHLYDLAIENINLNNDLKGNIEFVNKAAGIKRGKLDIIDSVGLYADQDSTSYVVDVITIPDIINNYNIKPDVLKMDCEGCEFDIIENEDLSMFKDIVFEHHSEMVGKDYNQLIDILKNQNFKIKTYRLHDLADFEVIGLIHAYK